MKNQKHKRADYKDKARPPISRYAAKKAARLSKEGDDVKIE